LLRFSTLGAIMAVRYAQDLDYWTRKASGRCEPGSRRWPIKSRRMGPLKRPLGPRLGSDGEPGDSHEEQHDQPAARAHDDVEPAVLALFLAERPSPPCGVVGHGPLPRSPLQRRQAMARLSISSKPPLERGTMCSKVGAFKSVPEPSIREPHQQQRQFCASASVLRLSFESLTIAGRHGSPCADRCVR
jgi:hypothetical protein